MASSSICLVAALLLVFLQVAQPSPHPPHGDDPDITSGHYEHLQRVSWFQCKVPQPRVFSVLEIFDASQRLGKAFYPDQTVLHRCDIGSGCCMIGGICGPVSEAAVRLPFKVTYLEEHGPHKKGSWQMEFHHFSNHTLCGCHTHLTTPLNHQHHHLKEEAWTHH